jgi:hypothetical protein
VPNSPGVSLEATIRDLERERYRQAAPPRISQQPVKLHAFLSIASPEPAIAQVGGCPCIFFGLKAECPGRILVIARNEINSLSFPAGDRLVISMPLPEIDCFTIEVTPNIESQTVDAGFDRVTKHALVFDLVAGNPPTVTFMAQKLFVEDRSYVVQVNRPCEIHTKADRLCLTCLAKPAEVALAECGHLLICAECSSTRAVKVHHCPLCS